MTTQTSSRLATTETVGGTAPTLLFIPGWCGDRTVFDPLLAELGRSRRALSVDLPAHGDSPAPASDFGVADVVDAIVKLVRDRGLTQVVPVTLSHAGWAGIELRRRLGADVVPGLVLLDWMVLGPPPGFLDALAGLQSPAWQQVREGLFAMWTTGVDVPSLHSYVDSMATYGPEHWQRAGREIAASFTDTMVPLDALAAIQPCPVLHLYAQPRDNAYLEAQRAYAASHPWFSVQRLDASSHFPMFETPERMVAALDAFVEEL